MTHHSFKINSPHVVHDTIEGETILVNLKNGNYYSFDKFGVVLWDLIVEGIHMNVLHKALQHRFNLSKEEGELLLSDFIRDLQKEELIIPIEIEAQEQEETMAIAQLEQFGLDPEKPVLHRYENLQDMLFLDPIHDTDEKGWPSGIVVHNPRDWNQGQA